MYADYLVMCDKSKEDLKVMVERFVEVCRRRGLSKVMLAPVCCMVVILCHGEKKKRSRIGTMKMDSFRGLLGFRRMDRTPKAQMRNVRSDEEGSTY